MSFRFVHHVMFLAVALATASPVAAQDPPPPTGELQGTVTGPAGEPIGDVTVTARGLRGGDPATTKTAADGTFTLTLPSAIYRVSFAKAGFASVDRAGIVVVPAAPFVMNMTLAPAGGTAAPAGQASAGTSTLGPGEVLVRITTALGVIDIAVDTARAPITAGNFLKYVDAGLYDGGRFYRVTRPDNYAAVPPSRPMMTLIQGGIDPAKNAQRLPAIPLERTSVTGLKHVVGTVSMARGAPDTATSEFFILLDDQPTLDFGGKRFDDEQGAAAFGRVVSGLDVVRAINRQGPLQEQNRQYLATPVAITTIKRVG